MKADSRFENLDLEFWANVKLLNQRLGYTIRKTKKNPEGGFVVPSIEGIERVFEDEGLSTKRLIEKDKRTDFGQLVVDYMEFRGNILTNEVEPNLMNKDQAKKLFYEMKKANTPKCPLPTNKQKKEKKDYSYLTGLVNMIIEANKGDLECDYDPEELTAITKDGFPIRTLSRRVDGAFPSVIDPQAIWEIKEYYYTTTFGSRVADGVYETQLDGWELWEAKQNTGIEVNHYMFVDDHFTWWGMGRSYLCRLIDTIHMGLVTEVIFGKEVIKRLPELVKDWAIDEKK
jgi:hypothetical protein